LTGFVYAPNADVSLGGNGAFNGAIMSKTASINGGFAFHYDEALKNAMPKRFAISSWSEL
jgi:hypothetical protein